MVDEEAGTPGAALAQPVVTLPAATAAAPAAAPATAPAATLAAAPADALAAAPADALAAAPADAPTAAPTAAPARSTAPVAAPTAEAKPAPACAYKPPKAPPGKSYLPTHLSPEAYGKKKVWGTSAANAAAQSQSREEKLAKARKEKEKEKLLKRQKTRALATEAQAKQHEEGEMSGFELFCMITAGLAFALFEALDFDVLIGLLIWPITKLLSISAAVFDTESIDPAVWMAKLGEAYSHLCREAPSLFVGAVFGLFALFALAVLFEADFSRWRRESELRAHGYRQLEVGDDGPTDEGLESLYKELDEDGGGSIDQEELARCVDCGPRVRVALSAAAGCSLCCGRILWWPPCCGLPCNLPASRSLAYALAAPSRGCLATRSTLK
jgi:hypothetical protein